MPLHEQITRSLVGLRGLDSDVPTTVGWSTDRGSTVAVDFTAVDSLSCAFRELRVSADEFKTAPFDALQAWAEGLCKKVTYLLEQISPVERDTAAHTVLIRSTPPAKQAEQTAFYEMLVQAPGILSLRRYTCAAQNPNRDSCDIQLTHEVLAKLVDDVVAAIPSATP